MEASQPPGSSLSIDRQRLPDGAVELSLVGELDLATIGRLERELDQVTAAEKRVVLDLRRLQFVDSTGLHALLRADRRLSEAGGQLTLVRGPRAVERLFALTGLDTRLHIVDRDELEPGCR